MNIALAVADALSNGVGLVLLMSLAVFIAALISDHITTIRKDLK